MRDNFKNHIENQREDFEIYPFEPNWEEVSQKLPVKQHRRYSKMKMLVAASVGLLFLTTAFWMGYQSQITASGLALEVGEVENFYAQQINQKVTFIASTPNGSEILADLDMMDMVFAELKEDLKENIDNEEVVAAMMENYRLKLEILERIVEQLEKENAQKSL